MKVAAFLSLLSLAAVGCDQDAPPAAQPTVNAVPAGHPGVGALPDLPGGTISGRIEIAPELAAQAQPGDVVFVVARNAATGTLIAVSRVEVGDLPLPFTLAGQNPMHGGASLAGKVRLEARLDKDGDAMTKNPGDLVGELDELVTVPAEDVVLTLSSTL